MVILSGVISKIDTVQAAVGVVNDKVTSVAAKGEFTSTDRTKLNGLSNYTGLHGELDSYINKSLWKADVSSLANGVNVTKVAGSVVTGISDFKTAAVDLSGVQSAIAAVKVDIAVINTKTSGLVNYSDGNVISRLNTLIARDSFGATDRVNIGNISSGVATISTKIDSSKAEIKDHVSNGLLPITTKVDSNAIKVEVDSIKNMVDVMFAEVGAIDSANANSLYAKIAALKADIANVKSSVIAVPEAVWGKVV